MRKLIITSLLTLPFITMKPEPIPPVYPYIMVDGKKAHYLEKWEEGRYTFWIGVDGFYYGQRTKLLNQ